MSENAKTKALAPRQLIPVVPKCDSECKVQIMIHTFGKEFISLSDELVREVEGVHVGCKSIADSRYTVADALASFDEWGAPDFGVDDLNSLFPGGHSCIWSTSSRQ